LFLRISRSSLSTYTQTATGLSYVMVYDLQPERKGQELHECAVGRTCSSYIFCLGCLGCLATPV
jgi:hypothetical protein